MDLVNYGLRERYEQIKKRGDKLDDIKRIIDWEGLRPLLTDLFTNDTDQGGDLTTTKSIICLLGLL
ncbi:MAG: hypothetical protein M0Z77_00610 [Thermoplasmatales archaeon]|jgi:hypothetical protein|nr:hypothetical protein [Candidatus Thermoplasmatota archaeon]MCL6003321.1 hypothetical protein [Candidatus Thermoplasmatota archaeon]MDA8054134.1 hypothetical protein [Thermoplasmatales archaeon]